MKINRFHILEGLLIIFLVVLGVAYLWYQSKYHPLSNQTPQTSDNPTVTTTTTPSTLPSTSIISEIQLSSLDELKAKTADWLTYENKDYGFKVKYPTGWEHYDKNSFPYGMAGQMPEYKATEIFYTNKPLDGPEDGVLINVFFSNNLSLIATKNSIVDYLEKYQWHIPHQINSFSLPNGFEGAISVGEGNGGRAQIGEVFRRVDNKVFYVAWSLMEDYQYSKSNYSNFSYQNQFFPFLASFEVMQ